MPPRLDDVVSPELVLVDPGLRARTRAGMVVSYAVREPIIVPACELEVVEPKPSRRRAWIPISVGAVLAAAGIGASTLVALAGTDPIARAASAESGRVRAAPDSTTGESLRRLGHPVQQDARPTADEPSGATTVPITRSLLAKAPSSDFRATRAADVTATALAWDGGAVAPSYEVELVRDGDVTYASTSRSSDVVIPRTWRREGVLYTLQPEDQLYVWPMVGGRRSDPVVEGLLAFELTPVARAIERMHPDAPR